MFQFFFPFIAIAGTLIQPPETYRYIYQPKQYNKLQQIKRKKKTAKHLTIGADE